MKALAAILSKVLSQKGVQTLLLNLATYLAKQTKSIDWDDEAVELFRKWSQK
jgi:hypothetical protein